MMDVLTDEQVQYRLASLREATAVTRQEGGRLSDTYLADCEKWARGQISLDELKRRMEAELDRIDREKDYASLH